MAAWSSRRVAPRAAPASPPDPARARVPVPGVDTHSAIGSATGRGARFTRRARLLKAREFQRVFEAPCRRTRDGITVLARRNALDHARLGLAVSKRQLKRAVDRNRIKRIARESFRHHQQRLAGWDLVVSARAGVIDSESRDLHAAFERLWADVAERCKHS